MLIENVFYLLFNSSNFFRIVYPHLDVKYFIDDEYKIVFEKIKDYNIKFNKQPHPSDIKLLIETDNNISEKNTELCYKFLAGLKNIEKVSDEVLVIQQVEEYVQQRALEIAILESVDIIQQNSKQKGLIEDKIKQALAVEFDVKIGMDFFKDAVCRYNKYIEEEEVIPTDIELLNALLNGGFRRKSLHCFLGRVNIGKSLILCHLAACMLKQGFNVLYVSAEMSEDMISKRIDANLLDIPMADLSKTLDKQSYLNKVKDFFKKTQGKMVVKEYPTGGANSNHIKNLIQEIHIKKGFIPDILILDYLNIFSSSRLGNAASLNSFQYVKSIAEEMRAVAVEFNLALITASQINRANANNSDIDMTATSESWGLPATSDWMGGIIQTPELFEQKRYLFKNIKSRFDSNINQVVTVGVEYTKMKLINLGDDEQQIPEHVKDQLRMNKTLEDNKSMYEGLDFN